MSLAEKKCVPCRGGVPPLTAAEIVPLQKEIDGWNVVNGHHLTKSYAFADFKTALDFVDRVGKLAEAEGHHPDVRLSWGAVQLDIWTHKIDGLTESDFVFAAKCDRLSR